MVKTIVLIGKYTYSSSATWQNKTLYFIINYNLHIIAFIIKFYDLILKHTTSDFSIRI